MCEFRESSDGGDPTPVQNKLNTHRLSLTATITICYIHSFYGQPDTDTHHSSEHQTDGESDLHQYGDLRTESKGLWVKNMGPLCDLFHFSCHMFRKLLLIDLIC